MWFVTQTATYTFTGVRYSTDPEIEMVRNLLVLCGASDISDHASTFAEIAGAARLTIENKETLGEHAKIITLQYDDVTRLIDDLGERYLQPDGENITRCLAGLMETISNNPNNDVRGWIADTKTVLLDQRKLPLTPEECFGLGLAIFLFAGSKEYRHGWRNRESATWQSLLDDRELTKESFAKLRDYWDEIHYPTTILEDNATRRR